MANLMNELVSERKILQINCTAVINRNLQLH